MRGVLDRFGIAVSYPDSAAGLRWTSRWFKISAVLASPTNIPCFVQLRLPLSLHHWTSPPLIQK